MRKVTFLELLAWEVGLPDEFFDALPSHLHLGLLMVWGPFAFFGALINPSDLEEFLLSHAVLAFTRFACF